MDSKRIMELLEKEGLDEIDQIEYKKDIQVYDFFYTYDSEELESAKAFANESTEKDISQKEWNEKYFLPFLTEIAADNIRDILGDICDELKLQGEFVAYEIDEDSFEQCEFVIILSEEGTEINVDDIFTELEL
jgi:hypothetical protein